MAASEKRRFSWLPSIPGPLWLLYGNVVLYAACYMAQVRPRSGACITRGSAS